MARGAALSRDWRGGGEVGVLPPVWSLCSEHTGLSQLAKGEGAEPGLGGGAGEGVPPGVLEMRNSGRFRNALFCIESKQTGGTGGGMSAAAAAGSRASRGERGRCLSCHPSH